jgi:hypothetical protein
MRVSLETGDRGYGPMNRRVRQVYLEGEPVTHVITADEELGLVYAYALDERGWPLVDVDGSLVREWRRGRVTVELVH